jgi:NAD(P)-dependent dehydrogenase (short-subunit alcohol dehydrogenase family)
VAKPEQVDDLAKQTLSRYGAVHVLCNNAGIYIGGGASWTNSLADWNWMLGVNVMGVVHGIRSFLPIMIEQDSEAHIVNTASLGGLVAAGSVLYGTGKFAVVGLTENLHAELQRGGFKPKVSVLCPGLVDTNIMVSSPRHRPEQSEGSGRPAGDLAGEGPNKMRSRVVDALKLGLSPRAVGDKVLAAIREDRFYIMTNPEFDSYIEQRTRNILKRF